MKTSSKTPLTSLVASMKISSLITIFTVSAFLFAVGDAYLLPYRSRYGDIWDAVVDPFKILEGLPTDIEAVALAKADWKETADSHIFTLDVPGIKRDEIKIEVEDKRVLRISGERRKEEEKQDENNKWHRVERSVGKFVRQFKLPEDVDMDGVKASLESGVLIVTVPKIKDLSSKNPKFIPIQESDAESRAAL